MNSLREWTKNFNINQERKGYNQRRHFFIYTYLHENFLQAVRLSCRNTEAKKEDDGKMNVVADVAKNSHTGLSCKKSSSSHRA
jgi:hypothetical protein